VSPINAKGEFQINFSKPLSIPSDLIELNKEAVEAFAFLTQELELQKIREAQEERERIGRGFDRRQRRLQFGEIFEDYVPEDISEDFDEDVAEEVAEEEPK